ncbi:MAG: S8 family serine peptidase [Halobacteriaceae archaeon]
MSETDVSRREVLAGLGASGVGALTFGTEAVSAGDVERHIVGTRTESARAAAQQRADSVHRTLDFGDIGQAVAGRFSTEALEALARNPNVRYIEPDGTMYAIAQTLPWGIDRVDAEKVHANGETGGDNTDGEGGADLAVIDTGIDSDHPDLQANLGKCKAFVDCKGGDCRYAWDDDEGHRTHCAGTADAIDNSEGVVGVSTAATLHAVKVLDNRGSGSFSDVAEGIEWTADQGYDVGSMSLGASSGSQTVKDACQYAYDKGVLLVAAAGNSGPCSDCVGYPAAYSTVIAVSATTQDDTLADYSSTGPEVELAAPGSNVYSTYVGGAYETLSGTSMACPHVSGAGAQLMDNGDTNTDARTQLKDTAEDIGLGSNESGAGLLDVEAALGGSSSTDSAPSVSWVNPAGGETVSGTVTVKIDASDSEDADDSLDVTYTVDGGSARSTSYNSTSGYYEDSWDTTAVSDGDHTLAATATDSAGNTSTKSITVTTDNTESEPSVDSLSASEVETSDSDAEFDVTWDVSDPDGDLSTVDLTLTDDTDGAEEDTASVTVSGSTASGTTRLVAAGDDGSGHGYTVSATVTDGAGNSSSASTAVSETESTNSAPSASIDSLNNRSNPRWDRYEVDWSASDSDGNLDTVTVEMVDSSGSTLDAVTTNVSGSSASGVDEVRSKQNGTDIVVTATDTAGASGSDSRSI